MNIHEMLQTCVEQNASDLHLSAGLKPVLRKHGDIIYIEDAPILIAEDLASMLDGIMNSDQKRIFEAKSDVDFTLDIPSIGRFRANVFNQHRGIAAAFRLIPTKIPSMEDLRSPAILKKLMLKPRGLILVTGPTGSGKSSTLAAMVDYLNTNTSRHIITIEDPIEMLHTPKKCLINQREVGVMADSFSSALRAALREDPDCIMVGELRDQETARLALTASETGHLVVATMHTSSAPKTIDRLVDLFPAGEKDMARGMLSESLLAVISQTLCKKSDNTGRVAAYEIMIATTAIRNLIREGKIAQMLSTIQTGASSGMISLDMALKELSKSNQISLIEAISKSNTPENITV